MKKIIFLFIFLLSNLTFSQNVTLDELINLRSQNLNEIEEKLALKGWSYENGQEPEGTKAGKVNFAYKKSQYDGTAVSFIKYYYSNSSNTRRIDIQISSIDKYNQFLSRVKSLGCKLIDSKITNNDLKKVYQNTKLTFIIVTSAYNKNYASYWLAIFENNDYNSTFNKNIYEEVAETNNYVVDTLVNEPKKKSQKTKYSIKKSKK
ncbi:hypothetical protein LIT56_11205 [Flavobacterium psychrophilum]|uniref:hypothetical protein n=1 Tax=Flavobacterium psychrophilum TaxID=96345 RepID=UPI001D082C82|nr:hypothetical protein [Flavobacterium psychrophilum]MCB5981561.1 hypothetical protein [Flavobacterium psychrophilum]MCB5989650.1 hypothetical protein [Flavobacterium psychrophilum]MCB6054995.1 hypothetical protein [Flavobacterium psychrophilum]MCB6057530.1 hypothetical protein [Flavobacterium psychrophilum]MCB6084365.1 hypothetical protein [Flavobacterium psychrophilum]